MQEVVRSKVNQKMAVVMAGIGKLFTGEIVEHGEWSLSAANHYLNNVSFFAARTAMEEWGEDGPLRPRHIREGYRRMKLAGKIPYSSKPSPFAR